MVRYPFCPLPCSLVKEVQLFPALGFYCGILALYFQCQSNKSESTGRTTTIISYAVYLLYVLCTVNFIIDLAVLEIELLEVSNNSICSMNIIFLSIVQSLFSSSISPSLETVQGVTSGCCDFLAQCILVRINNCTYHPFYSSKSSKIYRCWIVWGQNIHVVIIPSFLAVTYLGRSIYLHLISRFHFIASSYLGSATITRYLVPADHNKSRRNHGRECSGDRLDSVQDPQGVLGSQGC